MTSATAPAMTRLGSSRTVRVCIWLLGLLVVIALVGPFLSAYHYSDMNFEARFLAPGGGGGHWLGTDDLGRDLFARTLLGIRVTLFVAVIATAVSLGVGVVYGAVAGYLGGRIDAIMMRAVDSLYALPFVFFVILLMVAFERNFLLVFVAIGAINWLDMARVVRGETMSLRQRAFVEAARLGGVSTAGIIFRHIAPTWSGSSRSTPR